MDIRYSANPEDVKRYTTEELRKEFLIEDLFIRDELKVIYSHVDRMIVMGACPSGAAIDIDDFMDTKRELGTEFFLYNREMGILSISDGRGKVTLDDEIYELGKYDCLYVGRGTKKIIFEADDPNEPPCFYVVSCPAHKEYPTRLITNEMADKNTAGTPETSSERIVNRYINPAVLDTCQLSMGVTPLINNSVWMTMPAHTHERRMEVYLYNDLPEDQVIFHFMGESDETRHIVMKNRQAVISPSWSIHSGCGTHSFTLIWAMAGENKEFTDMDVIPNSELR